MNFQNGAQIIFANYRIELYDSASKLVRGGHGIAYGNGKCIYPIQHMTTTTFTAATYAINESLTREDGKKVLRVPTGVIPTIRSGEASREIVADVCYYLPET